MNWLVRRHELNVERGGVLMGIVNVTPDSFSDGGRFYALEEALGHAEELERQGAVILDIGGESTRPGAAEVSADEELAACCRGTGAPEAVGGRDFRGYAPCRRGGAVLEAGADVINDISGLSDPGMAELCAQARCGVVVMHMQGRPETMQDAPAYGDVLEEVHRYFEERYDFLLGKGAFAGTGLLGPRHRLRQDAEP